MQAGALTSVGSFVAGAAGGFGSALIASNGNLDAGLKGAISGGAFALAGDVGQAYGAYGGEHFAAHAAAGCLQGELSGGGCGRGALSGMAGLEGSRFGPIGAVVAGGTASVIGGGKFGNGAVTAAFGYLFNCMHHAVEACGGIRNWNGFGPPPLMAQANYDAALGLTRLWDNFTSWVGSVYDSLALSRAPTPPRFPAGWDGTTPPDKGWEWRGPDAPGGARGGWVSPDSGQSLHPDFNHPAPVGPHVDWNGPKGERWRIFPDGTVKPK